MWYCWQGGSGTRFWPLSRKAKPKQFHALTGRHSLLRQTWRRVRKLAPTARIWVVAPRALARSVRAELPELPKTNLILEPSPRDTAPAIALACAAVEKREPGAVVGIFPTDHIVRDNAEFVATVRVASEAAAAGSLVCLGIQPYRPATGFGYLQCAEKARARYADAGEAICRKTGPRSCKTLSKVGALPLERGNVRLEGESVSG